MLVIDPNHCSFVLLIGYKVSDTMRKGILDVNEYDGHEKELMMGCLSALSKFLHSEQT